MSIVLKVEKGSVPLAMISVSAVMIPFAMIVTIFITLLEGISAKSCGEIICKNHPDGIEMVECEFMLFLLLRKLL